MKRFSLFSCAMAFAIAGSFSSCGEKDELPALVPAYLTVAASDQVQDLLGDATNKSITVDANREIKVTVPAEASWLTATATAVDPTTGKATLNIAVANNTTAFKGRTATIQLECVAAREGDIVSSASAKATISVTQSLKGLPVADVFDLKLSADGKAEDGTGNLTVQIGPAAPKVAMNTAYNRLYATISQVESAKYAQLLASGGLNATATALNWGVDPGDKYWNEYSRDGEVKYLSYDKEGNVVMQSEGNRRMSFYKMQWGSTNLQPPLTTVGQNEKLVAAYESAFSYELVFRVGAWGFNGNIFGNLNPTHCGFGISAFGATETDVEGVGRVATGGRISFIYHLVFGTNYHMARNASAGGGLDTQGSEAGVEVEQGVWYHVVVTYNRSANIGEKALVMYVNGKEITWVNNNTEIKTHGLKFPADYYASSNGEHVHEGIGRTPNTEYLVVGGGSHQSGRPSGGVQEGTDVMIARVYGKALTADEVAASYNALTPE